jgi:hypothetical protein
MMAIELPEENPAVIVALATPVTALGTNTLFTSALFRAEPCAEIPLCPAYRMLAVEVVDATANVSRSATLLTLATSPPVPVPIMLHSASTIVPPLHVILAVPVVVDAAAHIAVAWFVMDALAFTSPSPFQIRSGSRLELAVEIADRAPTLSARADIEVEAVAVIVFATKTLFTLAECVMLATPVIVANITLFTTAVRRLEAVAIIDAAPLYLLVASICVRATAIIEA